MKDGARFEDPVRAAPAPEEVVPHRPPALFLEEILQLSGDTIRCRVRTPGADGELPLGCGIECMAQAAAAYGGSSGGAPRRGMLAGVRGLRARGPFVPAGTLLTAICRLESETGGASAFECELEGPDGDPLMSARILVHFPEEP